MGRQTEYLKGKYEEKNRIVKYLKHRQAGVVKMLNTAFKRSGSINPIILEVMFTYAAIISDIKNDRLD
ncbi:hypothetical protein LCGC14_1530250 [marine sediment metagenome]|uniref:Uncharacterized protein n=1 Tax=marine sediment metagenome TaxID=412755 RepID=A0A0F9IWD9_9ZZZZ